MALDMIDGSPNPLLKIFPRSGVLLSGCIAPSDHDGKSRWAARRGSHTLPLLYLYGVSWLNVGFLLFRDLDNLCWQALADSSNPIELAGFKMTISSISSHVLEWVHCGT